MANVGDCYSWKFHINAGTFLPQRLGAWYGSSGLRYNTEKPPHMEILKDDPSRQLVMIEAIVENADIFDLDAETEILRTRYSDTPTWDYEFISFTLDEKATEVQQQLMAQAEGRENMQREVEGRPEAIYPPEE